MCPKEARFDVAPSLFAAHNDATVALRKRDKGGL